MLIPRKDLFPTVHQMNVRTLIAGGVTPNRTQAIEHLQTAIALAAANAGVAFVPEPADKLHDANRGKLSENLGVSGISRFLRMTVPTSS